MHRATMISLSPDRDYIYVREIDISANYPCINILLLEGDNILLLESDLKSNANLMNGL